MIIKEENTWYGDLYICGDINNIRNIVRKHCFEGNCLTITPIEYIYTGGSEQGVKIGAIQYPRFPKEEEKLLDKLIELGYDILEANYQFSFTIVTRDKTHYYSRKPEDLNADK